MALKTTIQLRRDALSAWLAANPVLAPGEIALVDKNNGVGAKDWVIRIGDGVSTFDALPETAYALSANVAAELSVIKSDISALSATHIADVADINEQLNTLSSKHNEEVADLSSKILNKVKVNGESVDTLNVAHIDAADYHAMVKAGTVDANTVYVVSSEYLNAFNEQIKNVAPGTEETDAVNYGQLSSAVDELEGRINNIVAEGLGVEVINLSNDLRTLSTQVGDLTIEVDNISAEAERQFGVLDQKASDISAEAGRLIGLVDQKATDISTEAGRLIGLVDQKVDDLSTQHAEELATLSNDLTTALDVELVANGRAEGTNTISYTLKQGGSVKGNIEVPYDVFVDSGVVETKDDGKTYIVLTLNNAEQSKLEVEVTSLIDIYTGGVSDTITTTVDNYVISAEVNVDSIEAKHLKVDSVETEKIKDGAVTTSKLEDSAVTTAKIADGAITAAKFADEVFVFDCGGAFDTTKA